MFVDICNNNIGIFRICILFLKYLYKRNYVHLTLDISDYLYIIK